MLLSAHNHSDKRLFAVKVSGKWRLASKFVGKAYFEYKVDTSTMRLSISFGNAAYVFLFTPTKVIVEDFIAVEDGL